ncbi:MAG: cytochrome c oxidase subunit I, partial [Rhodospirillaceae bacterium]|nr:cytochrome c oxidase subunit I [Rhodospirillaceae bacterium]
SFASALFFVVVVIYSLKAGRKVDANYWGEGATTLEWTVASPAPWHTHEVMPDMTGKAPAE